MKLDIKISEKDLPVLSIIATQALQLLEDPKVTNQRIVDLICQDPSLAARVLRVANSPFYCGRVPSFTISDALFRLGIRNLTNVIIIAATGELFSDSDPVIHYLWDHATLIAMTSSYLAKLLAVKNVEEVFIAGLLHDIGKLVILHQHPDVYRTMLQYAISNKGKMHLIEDDNFSFFNHMSVGGLVVRKWKLHPSISEAARFHHDLELKIPVYSNFLPVVGLVSLSNRICSMAIAEEYPIALPPIFAQSCTKTLGISDQKLQEVSSKLYDHIRNRFLPMV